MSHAALPSAPTASLSKVQSHPLDDAPSSLTPPPSTQLPSSSRGKARTPTPPVSHISTPPPTIELHAQNGRSLRAFPGILSGEELEPASSEELRLKLVELQAAVQHEKMQAAHYKLQYNMLAQESAAAIERMHVEARMAQTESDVIAQAEQSKVPVTPLPQQEGFVPVQKALYQRMLRDIHILRENVQVLERETKDQDRMLTMQDDEIASLRDRATLMAERIRQSREQQNRSRRAQFSSRVDATPRSVYSTPQQRAHIGNRQQPQAFAALIQASEMASQESARSAGKKGHSRNVHSTSSLPSTPQRAQKLQQPAYQTPSGRQQPRKIPSTAPVARMSAMRTPDVYAQTSLPVSQAQDPQSDGTVSASDNDSEAETDILDQDDEIPQSQASLSASQMLRSGQEQQSKRDSFEGRGMLEPSRRTGGEKLRQTKLFGQGLEWVEKECAGERKQLYLSSDTKTTLYNTSVFSAGKSLRNAPRKKTKSGKVRIGPMHGKCCFGANVVLEKSHAAPFVYSRHAMPTRAITTAAARNAVLHTRELLEAIIHHLPMSDVLNLRSVCSTWKYTIDDSVSLQRKLFLKAVHTGDLWVTDTHTSTMRPSSSKQIREMSEQNPMESRYLVARPSQLNATFFARKPGHEKTPILHRAKYCERLSFTEQPDQIKHNTIWQSMFICQPAVNAVHIYLRYSGLLYNKILRFWYMDDQELRIEVVNEVEGIRYKDVVAAIHAAIETKHPGRDAAEFEIRVSDEHQRRASEVYMLGALFASGEEIKAVEELRDQECWSEETSQFIRGMEREPSLFLSEGPVGVNRTG
ncbi:uncharacterized protein MYCFIDRAFT_217061 [Pseudocercospora fijiensis CIRAD86]|uniref:F-box domain-containing protein n=1 Tax=Pseudocercospora fijiensis (strain CIRAD86) TaxID=383855 RepID=M3AJM7_PSEFD|nr:uncharacterized protein MYCFIDRAFT_217061 [Pseudocercospora fijiensis CIRAD86]EME77373.1 hypothetical protein MYCFIDRAFT_217061 [Pseudocercospora fijiensis CIRAD86]